MQSRMTGLYLRVRNKATPGLPECPKSTYDRASHRWQSPTKSYNQLQSRKKVVQSQALFNLRRRKLEDLNRVQDRRITLQYHLPPTLSQYAKNLAHRPQKNHATPSNWHQIPLSRNSRWPIQQQLSSLFLRTLLALRRITAVSKLMVFINLSQQNHK